MERAGHARKGDSQPLVHVVARAGGSTADHMDPRVGVPAAGAAHEPALGPRLGWLRRGARRCSRRMGWSIARREPWAPSAAAVVATLLLCDAWFDNVLANGHGEQLEAALEAVLVELPLALFCVWTRAPRASRPSKRCWAPSGGVVGNGRSDSVGLVAPADPRFPQLPLEPECSDPRARQTEAALVHEVARLPTREELRVEAIETLDLKPRVARARESGRSVRSGNPRGSRMSRANAAKLSDTSATPRARRCSIASTIKNSVRPFGVSCSRRMKESDTASRP